MRRLFLAVLLLGACATVADADPPGDSLDAIAADYVRLTLEIGEREPDPAGGFGGLTQNALRQQGSARRALAPHAYPRSGSERPCRKR